MVNFLNQFKQKISVDLIKLYWDAKTFIAICKCAKLIVSVFAPKLLIQIYGKYFQIKRI